MLLVCRYVPVLIPITNRPISTLGHQTSEPKRNSVRTGKIRTPAGRWHHRWAGERSTKSGASGSAWGAGEPRAASSDGRP